MYFDMYCKKLFVLTCIFFCVSRSLGAAGEFFKKHDVTCSYTYAINNVDTGYTTYAQAKKACNSDKECTGIKHRDCGKKFVWGKPRQKYYLCTSPPISKDGVCVYEKRDIEVAAVVHCKISSWTRWTFCSQYCGDGQQTRSRRVEVTAKNGGRQCPLDLYDTKDCHEIDCPVDCQLAEWSGWSKCSASCKSRRIRKIEMPSMGDGKTCEELDDWKKGMEETKACLGNICIRIRRGEGATAQVNDDRISIWDRMIRIGEHQLSVITLISIGSGVVVSILILMVWVIRRKKFRADRNVTDDGDTKEEIFRITHAFDDRDRQKKDEETPLSKTVSINDNDNLRIISSSENPYYGAPDNLEDEYRNRSTTNASVKITENVYYE